MDTRLGVTNDLATRNNATQARKPARLKTAVRIYKKYRTWPFIPKGEAADTTMSTARVTA
jgi:hypothetical protein